MSRYVFPVCVDMKKRYEKGVPTPDCFKVGSSLGNVRHRTKTSLESHAGYEKYVESQQEKCGPVNDDCRYDEESRP